MSARTVLGHWDVYELVHRLRSGQTDAFAASILTGLREGGVGTVLFAVGGDSRSHAGGSDLPLRGCLETLDVTLNEIDNAAALARLVRTREELDGLADDQVAFVLVFEGGRPLEGSLAVLRQLFRLGVRCMLLTWNGRNELADGVGEGERAGGLSTFGRAVVLEMKRLGMLLDLSHLAERGFWEAIELHGGTVVASHSNAKALHDHRRNLTDDQIRAVAASGGLVGIAFMPAFLGPGVPTVDTVVDHIEHMAGLVGIEHVGIGPDFSYGPTAEEHRRTRKYEGVKVDLNVPYPIPEATALRDLEARLRERGFGRDAVDAVMGGNFLRVLRAVLPSANEPAGGAGP